jgi:thiol-disulfide isomerase/thioredoxin
MNDKTRLVLKMLFIGVIAGVLIYKFCSFGADVPKKGAPINVLPPAVTDHKNIEQPGEKTTTLAPASVPKEAQVEEKLPVWLLFRSTTCIPCVEMQQTMDALKPEFAGKVGFVPIDVNDPVNEKLLQQYEIRYIPTTFLIDKNGILFEHQVGVLSSEDMRTKLTALSEVK